MRASPSLPPCDVVVRFRFDVIADLAIEIVEVGPSRDHHVRSVNTSDEERSMLLAIA